ncbi:MAG: DUF58 domain-containing protein [Spirochaetales bacterium]|nr:DUF58 domain-containing protein [Spirochaetales bacterium]
MKLFLVLLCIFLVLFFPFWFIQFCALTVLLIIVLSYMYSRLIYHGVTVTRNQDTIRAHKLQIIDIGFVIQNKSFLPVHYISVFESPGELSPLGDCRFVFALSRQQKKKLAYRVKGLARGEYELGPIIVKSADPLGLFPWERRIEKKCRVIVYPSIFKITRQISEGYPGGNINIKDKMYEDITRLKSIREYIPGDDVRHISWKVSARLGGLFTREYSSSLHSPALLALNLALEDYPLKRRYSHVEKAIEICASLINFFTTLKQETGLISSGLADRAHPQIQIRGGHEHAMLLLENLAVIKGCSEPVDIIGMLNNSHLRFPGGTRIILISPRLTAEQIQAFTLLRRRRMFLEYIPIAARTDSLVHPKVKTYSISELGGEALYA